MNNYKVHLNITDKKGNWKRFACNKKGHQDGTHKLSDVTCCNCAGKTNKGLVVDGYGYITSPLLK